MPLTRFTAEEILYYCVSIFAIATFASGFTRLFAESFANPPPEDEVKFEFNPITSLDIVGTIVFFLGGFGWSRQVNDQEIRFTKQKLGWLLISLIAPFASLTFALTAAYIKHFLWTDRVIEVLLGLSVATTAYHVLPIPPFAGSRLIYLILPSERVWRLFSKAGPFIILILVLLDRFAGFGFLRETLAPVVDGLSRFAAYH
ncbi:hypothetical protein ACFL0O_01745 [Thermodesulfobacteriota bacterium]